MRDQPFHRPKRCFHGGEEHPLQGHRILIVEDEYLIAADLMWIVEGAGAEVIGLAATVAAALPMIAAGHLTIGILDVNLREGDSLPLALRLSALGIPFIYHTSTVATSLSAPQWPNAPLVQKPARPVEIVAALSAL